MLVVVVDLVWQWFKDDRGHFRSHSRGPRFEMRICIAALQNLSRHINQGRPITKCVSLWIEACCDGQVSSSSIAHCG